MKKLIVFLFLLIAWFQQLYCIDGFGISAGCGISKFSSPSLESFPIGKNYSIELSIIFDQERHYEINLGYTWFNIQKYVISDYIGYKGVSSGTPFYNFKYKFLDSATLFRPNINVGFCTIPGLSISGGLGIETQIFNNLSINTTINGYADYLRTLDSELDISEIPICLIIYFKYYF